MPHLFLNGRVRGAEGSRREGAGCHGPNGYMLDSIASTLNCAKLYHVVDLIGFYVLALRHNYYAKLFELEKHVSKLQRIFLAMNL